LTTAIESDGKASIVVGFSLKLRDLEKDLIIQLLGDKGDPLFQDGEVEIKPYQTRKSIASAWVIQLSKIP